MSYRTLLATTGAAALLLGLAGPASATLVHTGDSTIDGSLCVGFDCSNNEPMGFATIKIEENNLRIAAADSSSVGGFPTRDWQIEFNSSSNGGDSYFKIRDCGNSGAAGSVSSTCGGTSMFTIEGGADNDSIYVESSGNQGGNVGLGTTNPAVDLDILSGNTPTVRLQQDGSNGFTPQSWDLAGNESNFFIRDVTNGSALPFRIEPGTASNTLYLDNNERVGIGTSAPDTALHIRQNGPAVLTLENTAQNSWNLNSSNSGNLIFSVTGVAGPRATLTSAGNLTLAGDLITGGAGNCAPPNPPCDAVFDPAVYTVPSIEEHAALMWENRHLPALDPTRPGEPINVTLKLTRMLNELEHAHIYIEQLNARVAQLEARLAAQE